MHSVQPCLIVFDGEDSWAEICSSQLVLIKKVLILSGVGERLREERDRLGLNQTDFGIAAGVSRGTQKAYELESSSPDVRYLAALQGMAVDVHFVLTGSRHSIDAASLSEEESLVLEQYRALPEHDRASVKRLTAALVATLRVKL
jgi:transcriptional regulator with XRE-family HTH domain